jgi:hypothetical protein
MQIPPISSAQSEFQRFGADPTVQKFHQLWNDWFNDPTRQTGQNLLDFIKENQAYFAALAKNKPGPPPRVPFDNACATAEKYLQAWLNHGCDPHAIEGPTEFVADIAKWINYTLQ